MSCTDCPRGCAARGADSYCGTDRPGRVAWRGVTLLEEHELAPTYEIFFTGCSLRCRFCTMSDAIYRPNEGAWMDPESLAAAVAAPDVPPFRTVSLVGGDPTVNRPYIQALRPALRRRLPGTPLVLNTNLFVSPEHAAEYARDYDVVVGDVHFFQPGCAGQLAGARGYPAVAMAAAETVLAAGGRLFLRVLVLPGHLACCARPTVEWAASLQGDLTLHVMTHYAPVGRALGHPTLGRELSDEEVAAARAMVPPGLRTPVEAPLAALAPRTRAHRDPETPVEIDAEGRLFAPYVTGDLLPVLVAGRPALRPRLRYLNNGETVMSDDS